MKKLMTFVALLALPVTSLFATETGEEIIELPAQLLHYGVPTPVIDVQYVPEMPASISGLDGYVLLQFDISKSGRLSNIQVVKSSHEKLAKYSLGMVRKWSFEDLHQRVTAQQPIIFEQENEVPQLLALR